MRRPLTAVAAVGALVALAVVLLVVELASGAADYGSLERENPCTATSDYPGSGIDPTLQRIMLNGLYGAACELGTSREELVLSLVPSVSGEDVQWDRDTIERAVEAGLLKAIDGAEQSGGISGTAAAILREVVRRAPLDWLIDRGSSLRDVIDGLGGLGALFGRD